MRRKEKVGGVDEKSKEEKKEYKRLEFILAVAPPARLGRVQAFLQTHWLVELQSKEKNLFE